MEHRIVKQEGYQRARAKCEWRVDWKWGETWIAARYFKTKKAAEAFVAYDKEWMRMVKGAPK